MYVCIYLCHTGICIVAVALRVSSLHFSPQHSHTAFSALPGVFVIYDYSPFLLHRKTKSNSLLRYLIRLCGAAGGIYALGGLLDKLIIAFSTLLKKDA